MVSYWRMDEVLVYVSATFSEKFNISNEASIGEVKLADFLGELYNDHLTHLGLVLNGSPSVLEQDLSIRFENLKLCVITYYPDWVEGKLSGFYLQVFEKPEINFHDADLMLAVSKFNNILINTSQIGQHQEKDRIIEPQIKKVATYIGSILTQEFPGLTVIAQMHFMSVSKLKRDFKEAYGVSPFAYYRKLQMDEAEQYLNAKRYRIGELARMYNFSNPSNFTTCYNRFKAKSVNWNIDLFS